MTSTVAGCFNPKILDGGFQCDPTMPSPCPDGYFCRDFSGSYLCTTGLGMPSPDDMASSGGGGGGGGGGSSGGDMAHPRDMTMLPPDMVQLPTNCTPSNLIINEVQTGPGTDEFIEVYNPCGNTITVSGAKLVYRAASASSDSSTLVATVSKAIPMQGFLLFANANYTGSVPADYSYANGLADGGGGVALRDSGGTILCSVGWGLANNGFQNGSAAPTEGTGKSIARTPNGANSNNDSADFKSSTPTPGAAN